MALPELPIPADQDARQESTDMNNRERAQTHRRAGDNFETKARWAEGHLYIDTGTGEQE